MRYLAPCLVLFVAAAVARAGEDPLELRVNRAIDRAAANLVSRQEEDGSWQKGDKVHPLGRTALCTFTLLHAGHGKDHPAVRKALSFLGVSDEYGGWKKPRSTYEASCLVLLLNALGKAHARQIHEICEWLAENFRAGTGLWGYPDGIADMSNTQYAVLALKAGERHGYRAPKIVWKRLVDSCLRLQADCGAVRYRADDMYRATMTHAALLILKFAHESLGTPPSRDVREAMERAHRWYREHYSVERNPFGEGWHKGNYYYYMYGLERYAVFFGLERIGEHDWYREGAEALLARQEKNGSWGNLEDTCFAVLFLRRATFTEPEVRGPVLPGEGGEEKDEPEKPKRPKPDEAAPHLREWLVAGPFPGKPGEDDAFLDTPVNVKRCVPVRGGPAGKQKWERYASPEDKVEFAKVLTARAWGSYFAASWLFAERDADVVLWLGSDDGIRVWLDGKQILFGHHHGYSGNDFYRLPLHLAKGRHKLILQVENIGYSCHFRARLTDPDGAAQTGVTASASRKEAR